MPEVPHGINGNTIVLESSKVLDKFDLSKFLLTNMSFIKTPTIIITIDATPKILTLNKEMTVIKISVPTECIPLETVLT